MKRPADAVHEAAQGCRVDVEVRPGRAVAAFGVGYNPWRKRIQVDLSEPPEEGRANAQLVALVADRFGVPAARVHVAAGATSRRKTLLIEGVDADEVRGILEAAA